ncbi:MAG: hypothetical protein KG012_04915 [Deltaproteobacteria bacterium]|nr:hypothetical protein [Deltaproteobacteria bacterium]
MKKFLVLSLVALMVLAFGTMAFAQAKKEEPKLEFKASGFIDMVTLYWRNQSAQAGPIFGPPGATFLPGGHQFDKENSAWSTRGHLKFDAVYGKAMSGTIFFEMDSTRWGDAGYPVTTTGHGTVGRWGGDESAIEIKNLFFTFAIPGMPVPMQATAGLQPLAVRPHVFLYTDGTGVKLDTRIDPATISLFYFKALEGKDASADDVDVYGLQASAKISTLTLGGYGFYYNMNTYPVDSSAVLAYGVSPGYESDMFWLGVFAGGKLGPVVLDFDFVYNTGEIERRGAFAVPAGAKRDVDFRGWMTRAKVDYPWEKFNFGAIGMYATGADMKKTSATGLPGSDVANGAGFSRKVGSYVVPPFSEQFAFGDGMVIQTGWVRAMTRMTVASATSLNRGAVGGTAFAQAYASFKATPWYKVTLKGMYIWDTTKNGNTIGNAVKASGVPRDDSDIGWEIDLINEINIYKNLKWDIALGYLWAGDALDYRVGATNTNKSPKNPYNIHTRLIYSF